MRLCFISHGPFNKWQGSYYGNPALVKLQEMIGPLYTEVELCVPVCDGPALDGYSELCTANVTIMPVPKYYDRWEIAALRRPLMLMRYLWLPIKRADTVLMNIPNYICVLAWLVCLLQRKRFVIRLAGDFSEVMRRTFQNHNMFFFGEIAAFLHRLVVKLMVKTCGLAIANGSELARIYGRNCSHVVPCVSSTYSETDIASIIAGSGSDELRILYVGRLDLNKGLFDLFEAAEDLLADGLRFRIVVAGDGSRRAEIRAKAEELGIISRVDFLGWIPIEKLTDIYSNCDIFVLPSYTEGLAKVVTEAMSNGLPVVATSVGGIPDVVENGKTGILVPPKDMPALRDALRTLILDEKLRRSMAAAGLERSHQFTMDAERACVKAALQKFGLLTSDT